MNEKKVKAVVQHMEEVSDHLIKMMDNDIARLKRLRKELEQVKGERE